MHKTPLMWSTYTHNFWTGCTKISTACHNCYAMSFLSKNGRDPTLIKRVNNKLFYQPLLYKDPCKIFVCSLSDFFHEQADIWRNDAWGVINNTPQHQYIMLTMRPERIQDNLPANLTTPLNNIWIGATVESEDYINRIEHLNKCKREHSSLKTFISVEPMLSRIDFCKNQKSLSLFRSLDWIIIGGETGTDKKHINYRPSKIKWFEHLIKQANESNIPVFFKQLGTALGKKYGMKGIHGAQWNKMPDELKIREFPKERI